MPPSFFECSTQFVYRRSDTGENGKEDGLRQLLYKGTEPLSGQPPMPTS